MLLTSHKYRRMAWRWT